MNQSETLNPSIEPVGCALLSSIFVRVRPQASADSSIIKGTPLSFIKINISGAEGARRKEWQQNRRNRAKPHLQNKEHRKNPLSPPLGRDPMLRKAAIVHCSRLTTGLQQTRELKKRSASALMNFLSSVDAWKVFMTRTGRGLKLKCWPNTEGTKARNE